VCERGLMPRGMTSRVYNIFNASAASVAPSLLARAAQAPWLLEVIVYVLARGHVSAHLPAADVGVVRERELGLPHVDGVRSDRTHVPEALLAGRKVGRSVQRGYHRLHGQAALHLALCVVYAPRFGGRLTDGTERLAAALGRPSGAVLGIAQRLDHVSSSVRSVYLRVHTTATNAMYVLTK